MRHADRQNTYLKNARDDARVRNTPRDVYRFNVPPFRNGRTVPLVQPSLALRIAAQQLLGIIKSAHTRAAGVVTLQARHESGSRADGSGCQHWGPWLHTNVRSSPAW